MNYNNELKAENSAGGQEAELDLEKLEQLKRQLRLEQNLLLGIIAGMVAATISAGIWGVITATIGYQIGYMAIGVGCLVGYSIRLLGQGIDPIFGVVGALFSFLGCFMGNFLTICYLVSVQQGISYMEILSVINIAMIIGVMTETFEVIDLLFYGFAIYMGYKFSFRTITEKELEHLV